MNLYFNLISFLIMCTLRLGIGQAEDIFNDLRLNETFETAAKEILHETNVKVFKNSINIV